MSLKVIKEHVKSVSNIQKITGSMKLVATSKFLKGDKMLKELRHFGAGTKKFYEVAKFAPDVERWCTMAVGSDKGLCGGIHHKVAHTAAKLTKEVLCIGDRIKSVLMLDFRQQIRLVVQGLGTNPPTFVTASRVASYTFGPEPEYSKVLIVYPVSMNVITYHIDQTAAYAFQALENKMNLLDRYETEPEDLMSYMEFSTASLIYYALIQSYVSEQASRITAMSMASKNAGNVKKTLVKKFNRLRQEKITMETLDIINGASYIQSMASKQKRQQIKQS